MTAWTDKIPEPIKRVGRSAAPLWRAFGLWNDADGLRMSAAMSFYGILSLAPLLVLLVAIMGWWLDREVLETGLITQISTIVGEQGGNLIREALVSSQEPSEGIVASVIGFGILIFGATGVFGELQEAFERLWTFGEEKKGDTNWWRTASLRLRGVGYILAFGFLLLISLAISTLLNLASGWAGTWLPLETLLRFLTEAVAFGVCTVLFVALMRMSSGRKPAMRFLVIGGVLGAVLFTVGRQLLAAYLSTAAVVSAYGAAGSLVVLLMWIYFSSGVLLFSAACAKALEQERMKMRVAPPSAPKSLLSSQTGQ